MSTRLRQLAAGIFDFRLDALFFDGGLTHDELSLT
jgi:hypothetical protein